jgi:hypothetical protein
MANKIFVFSLLLMIPFSVVLAVLSLIYCRKGYNPPYMRAVPVYCVGNAATNLFQAAFRSTYTITAGLFTLFELIFFVYFLTRILVSRKRRAVLWALTGLHLLYFGMNWLKGKVFGMNADMSLLEAVIVIVGCLMYFREMLLNPVIPVLNKEPAFWMVLGIFCYFVFFIPSVFFASYFALEKLENLTSAFYSLNNYAQIVMYALFIKAMTCLRKK